MKGQTLLELVAVVAVVIIVVVALTFATISSLRNSQFAQAQAQATKLAQEGIERVRAGRDRNSCIIQSGSFGNVCSWAGNKTECKGDPPNPVCGLGSSDSIWNYQIQEKCGDTTLVPPIYCYFTVDEDGNLSYKATSDKFPDNVEVISDENEKELFYRAVILSDVADVTASLRKEVTVVVKWDDFAGPHESRLKTILRNVSIP